jgi:hypothetical protein
MTLKSEADTRRTAGELHRDTLGPAHLVTLGRDLSGSLLTTIMEESIRLREIVVLQAEVEGLLEGRPADNLLVYCCVWTGHLSFLFLTGSRSSSP